MKAKLIKIDYQFFLYNAEDDLIGTTEESPYQRLSMKNCQAIERGYDLEELFDEVDDSIDYHEFDFTSFRLGFQKAIELMGDKKFSEEDMIKFSEYCLNNNDCFSDLNDNLSKFQSLQQREWDVEIEMIGPLVYPANLPKEGEERPAYRLKLDAEGCLILRRIFPDSSN